MFLSFPVGQLPPIVTRCVCAGGVSTVLCGRPSWITQASCLAWIGIWFHFSLISEAPSSAHFVSYHAISCWMHISKCASKSCHVQQQSSVDNARALLVLGNYLLKYYNIICIAVNIFGEKRQSFYFRSCPHMYSSVCKYLDSDTFDIVSAFQQIGFGMRYS